MPNIGIVRCPTSFPSSQTSRRQKTLPQVEKSDGQQLGIPQEEGQRWSQPHQSCAEKTAEQDDCQDLDDEFYQTGQGAVCLPLV